jgi:hypothetical protein
MSSSGSRALRAGGCRTTRAKREKKPNAAPQQSPSADLGLTSDLRQEAGAADLGPTRGPQQSSLADLGTVPRASQPATVERAEPRSGAQQRSSSYRGESREAAAAAYLADARVMARMGYVPESESWSTALEQVLVVGYVHAPERAQFVFEAIDQAEAEGTIDPPAPVRTPVPMTRTAARMDSLPHAELKLFVLALIGAVVGTALGFIVATVSGEPAEPLVLGIFGLVGVVIGSIQGLADD